jgi:hypothetical protein
MFNLIIICCILDKAHINQEAIEPLGCEPTLTDSRLGKEKVGNEAP